MSSLSGISSNGLNFTGLATGIDTNKIIDGLTALNQRRIDGKRAQQAQVTQQQATFSGLQVKLADLQTQLGKLARSAGGAFDARKVTSGDDTLVTGAASSTALTGTYSLTVQQLAKSHQTASAGLVDPSTTLKTGTVQIKVGGGTTTTVTVGAGNNTLQGLAAAINDAATDVRASVVNDGSSSRLFLSAAKTGAANTIAVTNNLTGGTGSDIDLTATTVQAAADAKVVLGSGAGAITLTSATNRVEGSLDGVTLNLVKADPTKAVTLSVAADTDGAKKAITDFVDSYNGVIDFIDKRDNYDSQSKDAGVLLGNRDAADLRNDLATALTTAVGGINPRANRLSAIGITFGDKGQLSVDSAKLDKALSGQAEGIAPSDIRKLFVLSGSSNTPGISFVVGLDKTRPSGSTPYRVNVTQAASRAVIRGGSAIASSVTITGSNNSFSIKVNNLTTAIVTIDPGSYTPTSLAAVIQSQIGTQYPGQVSVDLDVGRLQVTSLTYGANSQLAVTGGTALADLGLSGTETAQGQNVAGSFAVNGVSERASGNGQSLTGDSSNKNTAGLQVRVSLTPAEVGSGATADLTVTQGLAARLNQVVARYLDPVNGRLKTVDSGFQQRIKDIDATITRDNTSLEERKASLLKQFAAMESAVNSLKGLGNQIASSFGVLTFR